MEKKTAEKKKNKDDNSKSTNNINIPSKDTYTIIYRIVNIVSDLIDSLYEAQILDSGSNIHIINYYENFTYIRDVILEEVLFGEKSNYLIKAFKETIILIDIPQGLASIQLLNIILVPNYLANIVFLERLNQKSIH